jgi:hypothetical protein
MSAVNAWGVAPNIWASEGGALSVTMDDFTMLAAGQVGEDVSGSVLVAMNNFTMIARGSATNDAIGVINVVMDDFTMSASGALDYPAIGTLNATMDDFMLKTPSFGDDNKFISSIGASQITSIAINAKPIKAISK